MRYSSLLLAFTVAACSGDGPRFHSRDPLNEARAAIVARNFAEAVDLATEAVESDPENPAAHYELARADALQGNEPRALRELHLAIDKGLADAPRALADPAFNALRGSRAFATLADRASPRGSPLREARADEREPESRAEVEIRTANGRETIRAGDVSIDTDF